MDLIKTAVGLRKTIRNVGRMREIATIFARHGFAEFISTGVKGHIPNFVLPQSKSGDIREELEQSKQKDWGEILGSRLRLVFEELGPAFVKFGQLLGSREDLFDDSFIAEMHKLRDKVRAVPFDDVKETIATGIGDDIDNVFSEIEHEPIGTASIGVVFKAKLKNGEKVVVKVKRPGIDRMIETDFSILLFLIQQVERYSEEVRYLGVSRAIRDFATSLQNELNFHIEAMNCERLASNIKKHDEEEIFYLPKVYRDYSSRDVLVMEYLEGIPFSHREEIMKYQSELSPKLEKGIHIFLQTFLKDGFFHADLHGGNFFYLPNKQIGLIDFGLMGALGKSSRKNFIAIIYALITFNYENLVYEALDVAEFETIPDVDDLIADVRNALSPFVGLTVQQTDFTLVLKSVIDALRKHQVYLPREWFIVFRALMTLDGVGKSLDIDFDLYAIIEQDIHEIVTGAFNKEELIEEAIWAGKDALSAARILPRHLRWFTREWAKKGYTFDFRVSGHEKQFQGLATSLSFIGFALLSSVFTLCGVMVMGQEAFQHWEQVPTICWIFWGLAFLFLFRGLFILRKSKV